jgi:hypothetical protein
LRQLWQLEKCWELFHARGTRGPFKTYSADLIDGRVENTKEVPSPLDYDVIIRCRPDLWFHSFETPDFGTREHSQAGETFTLPMHIPRQATAYVPWWGKFGGSNDRFAMMGPISAHSYFTTYSRIPELAQDGCPIHPESLIHASIATNEIKPLFAEFSTLRTNGEMRGPEISTIDLARLHA